MEQPFWKSARNPRERIYYGDHVKWKFLYSLERIVFYPGYIRTLFRDLFFPTREKEESFKF